MTTEANPIRPAASDQAPARRHGGLHPGVLVAGGAVCTSVSAAFVKLADTSAGTAAFFRCAIALIVLVPMAAAVRRRSAATTWRSRLASLAAGVLLGVDYVFWAASIHEVGAGIATVLINIQVLAFPLLSAVFSKTALSRRFLASVPVLLTGVVFASGAIESTRGPGGASVSGLVFGVLAGLAYAGYLHLMRIGGGGGSAVSSVTVSTAAAAVVAAVMGVLWGGLDPAPPASSLGWLAALALSGQVLAWLLITTALPRLHPSVSAGLLLLHPVLAILVGFAIGERPTVTQLAGCVMVIGTVWYATRQGPAPEHSARV
ncbi:DMT family transporter [Actinomadura rupiterrae]|uniref:DMT family transporter n=1 Tax=Actinomadura rupiterrae TaxID=559627 RepID=UPI0020A519E5|nr:DMT family transporter [Actinomadura rupiterrae]MCP2341539.1 drug/metabolite transporter (DMT)-like permease [Actinomadura rupiterrae]